VKKYTFLIYGDERAASQATEARLHAQVDAYEVFTKSLVQSGNFLDGDPFLPTSTAKSVQVRNVATTTGDGPFEQTRQQLLAYHKVQGRGRRAGPRDGVADARRGLWNDRGPTRDAVRLALARQARWALHRTQVAVHGLASRRSCGIGSPQRSHVP
jgi:hypothetical protein